MSTPSTEALAGISFDEEDRNLFLVDDRRLRADALKYSLLPKLEVVLNEAVKIIREVYGIEAFEDSIIFRSPNFRPTQKRNGEIRVDYNWASVGLGGKRRRNKWIGFRRTDGKEVQIIPFLYLFDIKEDGLQIRFYPAWLSGLTHDSRADILEFFVQYQEIIHSLTYLAHMMPLYYYSDSVEPISTLREHYMDMLKLGNYDNSFESYRPASYPIGEKEIKRLARNFVAFFPVYDSLLQIAMGKPARIMELVGKLNAWLRVQWAKTSAEQPPAEPSEPAIDHEKARAAAEQRISVMSSLRWQVFARDNWRCVACGRSGEVAGVILHVDHIVPRSKGGADALDNYQTLCLECNLGKGNRDATNLRERP